MEQGMSRRSFVRGAGLAAGAAGVASVAGVSALADEAEAAWDYEADVVCVGFGGAGAVSAVTAAEAGAQVIILEKQAQGTEDAVLQTNSTRLSHSCMMDFADEEGARDFMRVACRNATPTDVQDEFAKYMVGTAEWVNERGGSMYVSEEDTSEYSYDVLPEGANYTAYLSEELGNGYWKSLQAAVDARDEIQVLYETPGQRLILDESGAVIGVEATQAGATLRVKARKGVILTCGGYEFDHDLVNQLMTASPCRFNGNPDNVGDGYRMALEVGADIWHTSLIGGEPIMYLDELKHGVNWYGKTSVWVDKYGRRFAGGPTSVNNFTEGTLPNHTASYACMNWDFEKCDFAATPFFLITDQSVPDAGGLPLIDWLGNLVGDHSFSEDWSEEVEKGWILKADTLEELGEQIAADPDGAGRMDPATLAETIATFNQYCEAGEDPEFHVAASGLNPVSQPPYYAIKMYPGCWNTFGGPRRNPRGHILNCRGEVIPGLFGAGELGSVLGFLYAGGGWNIMEGVASGRIAGEEAAVQEARA